MEDNVEFKVNIPYPELVSEMQRGMIGLHTMWNEHFGISVVECMAAGLIMIAHASGGPRYVYRIDLQNYSRNKIICKTISLKKNNNIYFYDFRTDIIEMQEGCVTGFLAQDEMEYAEIISYVIHMHPDERSAIRIAAR